MMNCGLRAEFVESAGVAKEKRHERFGGDRAEAAPGACAFSKGLRIVRAHSIESP